MLFKPVTERHTKIAIVLGGASLTGFDFSIIPNCIPIITCNFVADHIPRFDYWVSIDTNRPRHWLKNRLLHGQKYFYGVPDTATWLPDGVQALRRMPRGPLCDDPREIVTGSSGYASLNLAYHMHPRKVAILGLDGDGGHFYDLNEPFIEAGHKDPEGYFNSFPYLFSMAFGQLLKRKIIVMNGSPNSRVDVFPRDTPINVIEWLKE